MMAWSDGETIFETTLPGSDAAQLVEFSAGTQDPNPIHLDEDFAKGAGYPGILQQGPMTTGHFTRLLEEKVGQGQADIPGCLLHRPGLHGGAAPTERHCD